jgi:hypothetical protein
MTTKENIMTNEEIIKNIADEYELPVEQVALIWSVARAASDEWHYTSGQETLEDFVTQFIKDKLV